MQAAHSAFGFSLSLIAASILAPNLAAGEDVIEPLQPYVQSVVDSFDEIPEERRPLLDGLAALIAQQVAAGEELSISFICIANSRRSHLCQVWAQTAADYYAIPGIRTFSGGAEATACNIRTVRTLRRAGFSVAQATHGENPHYLVQYSEDLPPIDAFSKVYNQDGNPAEGFLAVMCCAEAEENCPVVYGAIDRVPLCYDDPKIADGTPEENARYDERCRQIAIEMFYVMSRVAEST